MADHLGSRRRLRPGLRVVRRDDAHLQAGLTPGRTTLLPVPPGDAAAPVRLPDQRLPDHLLVDTALLEQTATSEPAATAALAALIADHGAAAAQVLRARREARVRIAALPADLTMLRTLLRAAQVDPADGPPDPADSVALVVRRGEPRREDLDDLIRAGTPHLLVGAVEDTIVVGPFVAPGRTACLRCVDAHLAHDDPRRAVVVAQYAAEPGPLRADGVPDPLDPTLWAAALAVACHDVLRFLDGDTPLSWSRTLRLSRTGAPAWQRWRRHPGCGCAWGDGLRLP